MSGLASPVRTTCFPLFIIPAHSASEDARECADVAGVHVASLDPAIACRFPISSCAWLIGLQLRQHQTSQSKNAKAIFANERRLSRDHASRFAAAHAGHRVLRNLAPCFRLPTQNQLTAFQ